MSGWQSDVARSNRIDKLRKELRDDHGITDEQVNAIMHEAGFFGAETELMRFHDRLHYLCGDDHELGACPACEGMEEPEPVKRLTKQVAGRRRRLLILSLVLSTIVGWAYEVDHRWDGNERPSVEVMP